MYDNTTVSINIIGFIILNPFRNKVKRCFDPLAGLGYGIPQIIPLSKFIISSKQ